MSIFAETKCNFSPVSAEVYTALIHHFTCRLEARQALIYQLVLGLTGENGKYNYSKAVHVYSLFSHITCSAKNYKIALALTIPFGYYWHLHGLLFRLPGKAPFFVTFRKLEFRASTAFVVYMIFRTALP